MDDNESIATVADSFAAAGQLDGGDRDVVITAYENLLGYDVGFMAEAEARLGYWEDRLAGDLARDDFVATFLEQATSDAGRHVSAAEFAGNERAVEAIATVADDVAGNVGPSGTGVPLSTLATTAAAARAGDMPDDDDAVPARLGADIVDVRAGEVGAGVRVDGEVTHDGGGEARLVLQQGDRDVAASDIALGASAGTETVAATVTDPGLGAGAVTARLEVTEAGRERDDAIEVAVFRDEAFGRDLAFEWADPAESPSSGIGRVISEQERLPLFGGEEQGTGFLVSPQHVVTNAHVVSEGTFNGDLGSLESVGFKLDAASPADAGPRAVSEVHTRTEDFDPDWPADDLALLTLEEPVDGIEPAMPFDSAWSAAHDPVAAHSGAAVSWAGYPVAELEQGTRDFQWQAEGFVTGASLGGGGLELSDDLYGSAGASGSPVFATDASGDPELVGVYTGLLDNSPVAAPIDVDAHDWVLTLLQDDGYFLDAEFAEGPIPADELGPFADLDDDGGNGLLTGDLFPEPPAPPLLGTAEADAGA